MPYVLLTSKFMEAHFVYGDNSFQDFMEEDSLQHCHVALFETEEECHSEVRKWKAIFPEYFTESSYRIVKVGEGKCPF